MSTLLIVPIHVDALFLHQARYVTEPMADFTRLPYFDKELGRDVNSDTPYLSEAILSKPFQDQRLLLKPGIHLHWSLPDALTQAKHEHGVITFPAVPNRWLITRRQIDQKPSDLEKQWVVESDFLSEENPGSVNYPYIPEQMPPTRAGSPFYYLGRKIPLEVWKAGTADGIHLTKLTAVGHGEPTFAAFYPNCHSVFGFHDPEYDRQSVLAGLRYDIIGWYASPEADELHKTLDELFKENWYVSLSEDEKKWQAVIQAIREILGWTIQNDISKSLSPPEKMRMLCYAQITFDPQSDTDFTHPDLMNAETGVSVGNTATEALAAHLSSHFLDIKPDDLEDLLEALQLADHLEQKRLDVGPKFNEARHESTFRALSPGKLWTIRQKADNSEGANVIQEQQREEIVRAQQKNPELAQALDQLNRLQATYDRALQELEDLRAQTFADWYKYMVCAYPPETSRDSYPDIDEIKYFIETKDILPLQDLEARTGMFRRDNLGHILPPDHPGDSLAHQIAQAYDRVWKLLETTNQSMTAENAKAELSLQEITPPRYYLPNEPIVLFTGDAATPSDRHGQDGRLHPDGLLECLMVAASMDNPFDSTENLQAVRKKIISLFSNLSETDSVAIRIWKHHPWHPIILQWEVEFFPTRDGNNLDNENRSYQRDFVARNYALAEKNVELQIKPNKIPPDKAACLYSGTTILSPAAQSVLSERILTYLENHLLSEYYTAQKVSETEQSDNYFQMNCSTILSWYKTNGSNKNFKTLIRVYEHLQEDGGSNLSQALGGFNEALLMHKVTHQTPVADPIGFEPYRTFTEQDVRNAVGQQTTRAPQPLDDFGPIRAGALKLLRLRLIDNFGIAHDAKVENMTTSQQLRIEGHQGWVAMFPRLAQPARVNFRWLAANQGSEETNSVMDTSPICGWLLPNNLDDSLAVYTHEGHALGSLYALEDPNNPAFALWRSAPGSKQSVAIGEIPNIHLRKVISHLQHQGKDFVGNFLATIDSVLAGIDPESAAQHDSLALLIGRPIAVVRASVNLELMGLPAVNQSWNSFRQDLRRSRRETDGFTQVRFPIRIGEYHQLNDGLIGYWQEDSAFQIDAPFYAAQSEPNASKDIVTYHEEPIVIEQAIDSPSQYLTMLVDPRGVVHATSGILPTKAISIPADQYRDALRQIEITFFSAPILSEANQLDLPLPREPGYLWSWLQKVDAEWTEISTLQTIRRSIFVEAMSELGDTLWQDLIRQGWLTPLDEETALVVAPDQRHSLDLSLDPTLQVKLEQVLDHPTVDPARVQAHFLSQPTVREGWLKLRRTPNADE